MKTTHTIKLNQNEMNNLRWAVGYLLRQIDADMKPWSDFDETPPEFLQEQYDEVSALYRKLCNPF